MSLFAALPQPTNQFFSPPSPTIYCTLRGPMTPISYGFRSCAWDSTQMPSSIRLQVCAACCGLYVLTSSVREFRRHVSSLCITSSFY
ncbi:hypothetical protein MPTK1_8g12410 [Marchantia polymorpha subsp. ruderalis]|uniref:Uncharacterized protein n=1 Tax=Marchantia polymorpha TaxID=3197 RepID=A0A2R6WJX0_MARPO|nr:hypothetical protein MARPO_0083s0079 [Marchantia polymorpha]BBN19646.1 hypothetical protein Mp_8g12410 [Marchantia polymorpha subsp. ruderalis]|eukprot:PTQ34121.1 hypothetical protein MARPO_0083s0079 [Marchantia polymorpha]